jgi:hypothetical protein
MRRRSFLRNTGIAAAGLSVPTILTGLPKSREEKLKRVGMNTIPFRMSFPATRVEGHPIVGPNLTLFDIPEYYADRFKLHNLEFWGRHFETPSPGYIADLKKAIAKTHSRLINVQLDNQPYREGNLGGYFLASRDDAMRAKSLTFVKEWIDVVAALGSDAIRVNTENGDFNLCVQSFRKITEYAVKRNVVMLVENHGGISANPDLHVRLIREVNHSNIRTLPDFGNHKPEIRYEALKAIMPYAYQVSPKALPFNAQGEHNGYDFGRCMRIAIDAGFTGIYSADYWDRDSKSIDYEIIMDWVIDYIVEHL